jgi:RNA polymerase sigma-70 factor (ECF subfamily)
MNSPNEQFSRIYDEYIEKIYRFVYLKVSSKEVAEDISSKTFLKAWQVFQNDPSSIKNVNAFLYKIAGNMVVDHYRERGRTKTVADDYFPKMVDTKTNLHESAVLASDLETVKKAIQNLKKEYQDVLIFHYLEDMPIGEIATILNKPEGTIRVMIHRGLQSLKNELVNEA